MKIIFLTILLLLPIQAHAIDAPKSAETIKASTSDPILTYPNNSIITYHMDVKYEGKVVYEGEVVYLKGFKNACKCCHYKKGL